MSYSQYGVYPRPGGCGCGGSGTVQARQPAAYFHAPPSVIAQIEEAIRDEWHDEMYYKQLAALSPTKAEKDIILGIADDEHRHNPMFRWLYRNLSGRELPLTPMPLPAPPTDYLNGITRALFGEIHAIEQYRKIYAELPAGSVYRDVVFDIMTDEFNHQSKFNYLFSLNVNKQ